MPRRASNLAGLVLPMAVAGLLSACATPGEAPDVRDGCRALEAAVEGVVQQVTCGPSLAVAPLIEGQPMYRALDFVAPNWVLSHQALGTDRVRIALRRKGFAAGREGEAAQLFARRAEQLARAAGHSGYRLLEYTEGINGGFPLAERVAQGIIEFSSNAP